MRLAKPLPCGIGPGTIEFLPEPPESERLSTTQFVDPCMLVSRASVYRVLGPIAYALWGEMVADPSRDRWWELDTPLEILRERMERNGVLFIPPGRSTSGDWRYSVSIRSVYRAAQRLYDLGFVDRVRAKTRDGKPVVTRAAFGITHSRAPGATSDKDTSLPIALARSLHSLPSWNGHGGNRWVRVESGRFAGKISVPLPCSIRSESSAGGAIPVQSQVANGGSSGRYTLYADRGVTLQVAGADHTKGILELALPSDVPLTRKSAATRRDLVCSENRTTDEDPIEAFRSLVSAPRDHVADVSPLPASVRALIPPTVIEDPDRPKFRIPPPVRLDTKMTDDEAVRLLVLAYRSASAHLFRSKCYAFSRGDIRSAKQYPALLAFARAAKSHKIAPHAWAKWKIGIYRKDHPEAKSAPLWAVFNAKSLDNERTVRWYFGAADWNDCEGIVRSLPSVHELDRMRSDMEAALRLRKVEGATDAELIRFARERRAAWEARRADIQADSATAQASAVARMFGGAWIWE